MDNTHPNGLLHPLPIPKQEWESVSMDFITGLPKVQGKDNIYVVVDRLTKFSHFFAITSTISTSEFVSLFLKYVFRLHGLPKPIISDWDNNFTGAFWKARFELVGTNMNMSTRYHPWTDVQIERLNQWLEGYLRNYVTR